MYTYTQLCNVSGNWLFESLLYTWMIWTSMSIYMTLWPCMHTYFCNCSCSWLLATLMEATRPEWYIHTNVNIVTMSTQAYLCNFSSSWLLATLMGCHTQHRRYTHTHTDLAMCTNNTHLCNFSRSWLHATQMGVTPSASGTLQSAPLWTSNRTWQEDRIMSNCAHLRTRRQNYAWLWPFKKDCVSALFNQPSEPIVASNYHKILWS